MRYRPSVYATLKAFSDLKTQFHPKAIHPIFLSETDWSSIFGGADARHFDFLKGLEELRKIRVSLHNIKPSILTLNELTRERSQSKWDMPKVEQVHLKIQKKVEEG